MLLLGFPVCGGALLLVCRLFFFFYALVGFDFVFKIKTVKLWPAKSQFVYIYIIF